MADLTETDRIFSPSYYNKNGDKPQEAIEKWVNFQEQCFRDTLQKFNVDFDISYGRKLLQFLASKTLLYFFHL